MIVNFKWKSQVYTSIIKAKYITAKNQKRKISVYKHNFWELNFTLPLSGLPTLRKKWAENF